MLEFTEQHTVNNLKISCLKSDAFVNKLLKHNIIWGENFNFLFETLIDKQSNVIDCGAYIGTLSILMSKYISYTNKIYSFEPIFFPILQQNIIQNNITNIEIYNIGLSNKTSYVKPFVLQISDDTNYGTFSFKILPKEIINFSDTEQNKDDIKFTTLDSFNFNNISLIKIDVEHFEPEVLEGSIQTIITNNFPSILIELFVDEIWIQKSKYYNENSELIKTCCFKVFSILSSLEYISIPICIHDGEFLFIHKSKPEKISEILNKLKHTQFIDNDYYLSLIRR